MDDYSKAKQERFGKREERSNVVEEVRRYLVVVFVLCRNVYGQT
jgi:hypothetical protein